MKAYIENTAKAYVDNIMNGTKIPKRRKGMAEAFKTEAHCIAAFNDAEEISEVIRKRVVVLLKEAIIFKARQSIRTSDLTPYMKRKEWNQFVTGIGRVDLVGKLNQW